MSLRPPSPIPHPRRLLVRGVNWLGDAVMTTPALQRLREHFPEARLTLLTHQKLTDLWRHHPSLDALLTFAPGESPWTVARRLRREDFQLALVLPNSPRSALEAWLAGIPQRIGYARPWGNWFLTQPVAPRPDHVPMRKLSARQVHRLIRISTASQFNPPSRSTFHASRITHHPLSPLSPSAHHIHQYLHLVAALGGNPAPAPVQLAVQPEEIQRAALKFGLGRELDGGLPLLGLNPGAEYGPAKRWPVDRFITAAREIQKRTNCTWLVLGGKSDVPAAEAIHSALCTPHAALHNLAGKTSLRELMALLKLCRVLLTNDTGPMHLAAALGTPVVVPFGSTSPELTGPGLPGDARHHLLKSDSPCSPCFRRTCPIDFRCMAAITVERVVEAVECAILHLPFSPS